MWVLAVASLVNRAGTMVLPFLVLYLTREAGLSAREASVYVRRITGTMLGALGLVLMIFAVGLSTIRSVPHA